MIGCEDLQGQNGFSVIFMGLKNSLCLFIMLTFATPCWGDDDDIRLWHFDQDGVTSVVANSLQHRKHWGFIDKTGKFLVVPRHDAVKRFSNGVAIVKDGDQCFSIDRSEKILSGPRTFIEEASEANERRWAREAEDKAAQNKSKYRGDIWDATGQKLIANASEVNLSIFSEGLAACEIPVHLMSKFDQNSLIRSSGAISPHGYPDSVAPEDRNHNRYGFIDTRGRMVIPPRFYYANDFHNGVASVDHWATELQPDAQKSGYINRDGQLIGGKYFDYAWSFENGFAIIRKKAIDGIGEEWGFIDDHGRQIMDGYVEVHSFSEGLAGVKLKNGKWGFIDTDSKMIVSPQFDLVQREFSDGLIYVKSAQGFGFMDKTGKLVIPPHLADAGGFSEGWAAAAIDAPQNEKLKLLADNVEWHCGFIDTKGHQAIFPRFYGARHFSEGLCAVQDGLLWGFINNAGKMVIAPRFDAAMSFSEGLAAVMKNDNWGFIDKTGNYVIAPIFPTYAYDVEGELVQPPKKFSEGYALVCGQDLEWHFIDRSGLEPIRMHCAGGPSNDDIAKLFSEGLAAVDDRNFGNVGYIDHKGHLQIAHQFEKADSFSEGLAAVYFSPKPAKTMQLPAPFSFPKADIESIPAKYGYINKSGLFVIKPQFEYCGAFKNGLAPAGFNKPLPHVPSGNVSGWTIPPGSEPRVNWGFIDKTGKFLDKPTFDEAQEFSEGLAGVRSSNKWGFIDTAGQFVVKPNFQDERHFSEGLAAVKFQNKWGYIDKSGMFAIPAKYWLSGAFSNGRALVVIPGKLSTAASTDQAWSQPKKNVTELWRFQQRGWGPSASDWEGHH
jgi:hypothetical protein